MGTVVGIIDGTGSLGAAFGQFIVKYFRLTVSFRSDSLLKTRVGAPYSP
jgi:hypothetical protein